MAKSIQIDFPVRDHHAELQQRLADAPTEHAAAILEFLDLLDVLHERKILAAVRGAVGAGDDLVGHLAKAAAQPKSVRAFRNLLAVAKILSSIDPELIGAVQKSISPQFTDSNARRQAPAPGLFRIVRTFWSAPVRRSLLAVGFMLAGIGHYMNHEASSPAHKA